MNSDQLEDLRAVADGHDFAAALREATGRTRLPSQAARDLRDLEARGLVEKIPKTGTRYRVTRRGHWALREGRLPLYS